jgi:phosphoribosylformylglycinamidine synthase
MNANPRVLLVRAPGTNCDVETAFAFEKAGAKVSTAHVQSLIENPQAGSGFQILCFPGGFSYGDDIAAGRILAQQLEVHLPDLIGEFQSHDKLVLGICNGFQILMRMGVFFPGHGHSTPATLTQNLHSRFEDRWVHLACGNSNSVFLSGIQKMYLPVAHAEGRFVVRDQSTALQLMNNQQLGLRYSNRAGELVDASLPFPDNPNGADFNVAGISDPTGRIFGLMPHPERHLDPTHHPYWTRRDTQPEFGDGMAIFANAVQYFA